MERMTRRGFLQGVAASAGLGSVAMLGLAGCSPKSTQEASSSEPSGQAEGSARTPGYCGPGEWLGEAPNIADSEIVDEKDFDVVVVGAGHAGIMAACGAVDEGASVAVLELQPWSNFIAYEGDDPLSVGWYGEDIGHVNSKFLIERGYGPYNTGEIVADFCKRAGGRVNPDIVRSFVQNSGAMMDRYKEIYDSYEADRKANDSDVFLAGVGVLLGDQDVPDEGNFDMSNMFEYPLCNTQAGWDGSSGNYPIEAGGYKTWPCNAQFYGYQGENIEYVHKYIVQYTQDQGAEWFFEHEGTVLVQNDAGDVVGIIAKGPDGYVKFNAKKAVVLCSGDFIGDPDMCWALLNEGMEWGERAGYSKEDWAQTSLRSGAGHKMTCWAGGMIEPTPRCWMANDAGVKGPWGNAPAFIANAHGKRFCNEAAIAQLEGVCARQPEGLACWILDANWRDTVSQASLDHGAPNFGMEDFKNRLEAEMDAVEVGNAEGSDVSVAYIAARKFVKSKVFAANSIEELATMLGYEGDAAKNLVASIEHYNEMCNSDDGDVDYGKDKKYMLPISTPPFYGGAGALTHTAPLKMVTLSGVVTDEEQRPVRKSDWSVIKGLYVAGNCLGGRYGPGYNTPFAGNSIGMAMTHGWLAGKAAANL